MRTFPSKLAIQLIAALTFGLFAASVSAEGRPITIIVPYPAGGGTDTIARNLGRLLQPVLDQPILIENITGAGSRIAHQTLMRAPPDGHKLLLTTSDLSINQALRKSPPWNIDKDFTHIANLGDAAIVYVVNAKVPVKDMREFLAYAKQQASKGTPVNYGSGGIGSILHLPTLELAAKHKLEMTHVPYRGAVPLVQDLSGGVIEFGVVNPVNAIGRDGTIRALAITGANRHPMIPSVPTMTESGFPDVNTTSLVELIGPAKMPAEVTKRLQGALQKVVTTEAFRSAMLSAGIEPGWAIDDELQRLLRSDLKKWEELARTSGVALED